MATKVQAKTKVDVSRLSKLNSSESISLFEDSRPKDSIHYEKRKHWGTNPNRPKVAVDEALLLSDLIIYENWPALFMALNHHKTDTGKPMNFEKYPAQVAFLKDNSKIIYIMKCVQVGITECILIKILEKVLSGWRVIYVLPTERLRDRFVAERVDKPLMIVPLYRNAVQSSTGDADQRSMKHLGNGVLYLFGSNSEAAFLSTPADMLVVDEEDKCDSMNLKLAPDRLDASEHKYDWRVGNPTYRKRGIHSHYLESDQREWSIRCSSCGEVQELNWFKNAVEEISEGEYRLRDKEWKRHCGRDIKLFCRKCEGEIDRFSEGEWVPHNPSSHISGYHFNQLFSPTKTIEEIYDHFLLGLTDPNEMQTFFNSKLGLPYSMGGAGLSESILLTRCVKDYILPSGSEEETTMGVDVGSKLDIRISDEPKTGVRRMLFAGAVNDWSEVDRFMERYSVGYCVVDAHPELHKAKEFQSRHEGKVWLCNYGLDDSSLFWRVDEDQRSILVHRTASLDASLSDFLAGRNWIPRNFRSLRPNERGEGEYVAQLEAPKRIKIDTPRGERYIWDEDGKPDHQRHADNYDYLARRIRNEIGSQTPGVLIV